MWRISRLQLWQFARHGHPMERKFLPRFTLLEYVFSKILPHSPCLRRERSILSKFDVSSYSGLHRALMNEPVTFAFYIYV